MFAEKPFFSFFFFNDTATTEIYTLSLHDALPIYHRRDRRGLPRSGRSRDQHQAARTVGERPHHDGERSEEHTSELQSPCNLVCRLLLEKKKNKYHTAPSWRGWCSPRVRPSMTTRL